MKNSDIGNNNLQNIQTNLVQEMTQRWPPKRSESFRFKRKKEADNVNESVIQMPLMALQGSEETQKVTNQTMESEHALGQFAIILGAKKSHVAQNLKEYLHMLKKHQLDEHGAIIEDIRKGIDKLKNGLSKRALEDFKKATSREMNNENELFIRCKLFASLMVISHSDNIENGARFRTMEQLEDQDKNEMRVTIQNAIDTMDSENLNTNEVRQLSYNLWSLVNDFVKNKSAVHDKDPMEAYIDVSKLPSDETCAAHLQIGTTHSSTPIFVFLWYQKLLFIRKNHNIFTIPRTYFQQTGTSLVKIELEKRGNQVVCLYGDKFDHTADKSAQYPDDIISSTEHLESLKNKNGKHLAY